MILAAVLLLFPSVEVLGRFVEGAKERHRKPLLAVQETPLQEVAFKEHGQSMAKDRPPDPIFFLFGDHPR